MRAERHLHPMRHLGLPPSVWRVVHDYCQQSTLHGLKYISNPCLTYIERYLWLMTFLASVGLAVHLIYNVWVFWVEKPYLITFDSHMTAIWAVPFPSVTLCTYLTVKRSIVDLAATNNKTVLFYASLICPLSATLSEKAPELENMGNEFYEFIQHVSPTCSDMMKRCSLWNKEVDCCDLFDPIVTDSGLCFVFNNLPLYRIFSNVTYVPFPTKPLPPQTRFWEPQKGYPSPDLRGSNGSYTTYPLWEQMAGESYGLSVELYQNITEWQQLCSGAYSGFKVLLNNPASLPVYSKVDMRVSMDRETNLMLTPTALFSRKDMADLPPSIRSCVFPFESPLSFFQEYTDSNCQLECKAQFYIRHCGCVPFYFPKPENLRICSRKQDFFCLSRALAIMTNSAMERSGNEKPLVETCDCLPECQKISYKSADFYTDFVYSGIDPPWATSKVAENSVTRISIYFSSNQFLGKHRSVRYTNLKFAGTCGGLLSLLLGFSVISAIEMLYAFLLRPLSRLLHAKCARRLPHSDSHRMGRTGISVGDKGSIPTAQYLGGPSRSRLAVTTISIQHRAINNFSLPDIVK